MKTKDVVSIGLCTALICVGAFIKIPIPIIPFTLQFMFINLTGLLLGWKKGLLAVIVYISLGLLGLPVFSGGGGLSYITMPSFGFVLGFIPLVILAGICSKNASSLKGYFKASIPGYLALYMVALPYLYIYLNVITGKDLGIAYLIGAYFIKFMVTDVIQLYVSSLLAKKIRPIINL
ncbi:MAG: biotin transporter BioY [Erysipelotrichaceae bacterium]